MASNKYVGSAFFFVILAILCPFIIALLLSFWVAGGHLGWGRFTLAAYAEVLSAGRWTEYKTILLRAVAVATACQMIAIPVAYWLVRLKSAAFRTVFLVLLALPFIISDALRAFGWQLLLAPDGPVVFAWRYLAGNGAQMSLRYNAWVPLMALVASMSPFAVFSVLAALPQPDTAIWRAADELSATAKATFQRIAIPLSTPGVVVGWSVIVALVLVSNAEVRYLGGPTQTSAQTILASLLNVSIPSALAFTTLLTTFVFAVLTGALAIRRWWLLRPTSKGGNNPGAPLSKGGVVVEDRLLNIPAVARTQIRLVWTHRLFVTVTGLLCASLAIFSLVSILAIVVLSLTQQQTSMGARWTLDNFRAAYQSVTLEEAFWSSIGVAVAVGLFSAALATMLGFVWWRPKIRTWVIAATSLGVIMSPDAYSICLEQMLRLFGVESGSLFLVFIAHMAWSLPIGLMFVLLSYRQTSVPMLRAGVELSGGQVWRLRSVVISTNQSAILSCGVTGFLMSINEYTRASYLAGGSRTLSTEVFGRLASGFITGDNGIYAVATTTTLVTVVIVVTGVFFLSSGWHLRSKRREPSRRLE